MSGVTEHGIRYPDGSTKAKNLGAELETFADDVDKLVFGQAHEELTEAAREIVLDLANASIPPMVAAEIDRNHLVSVNLAGLPVSESLAIVGHAAAFTAGKFGNGMSRVCAAIAPEAAAYVAAHPPAVAFTADGWVKLDAAPSGNRVMWSISTANADRPWWLGVGSDGKIRHQGAGGAATGPTTGPSIADGLWHHVAVQVGFSTATGWTAQGIWVDGQPLTLATSGTTLAHNWGNQGQIVLGGLVTSGEARTAFLWPGMLDEWRYRPSAVWTPGTAFTPPTAAGTVTGAGQIISHLESFVMDWYDTAARTGTMRALIAPTAFTPGKFGNALTGATAIVSSRAAADLATRPPVQFTIDGWLKAPTPTGNRVAWCITTALATRPWWIGVGSDGKIRHQGFNGAVVATQDGPVIADDAWHHVAALVAYDVAAGFTVTGIWQDGQPLTLAASNLTLANTWGDGTVCFGGLLSSGAPSASFAWLGSLDEWRYRPEVVWTPGTAFVPPTAPSVMDTKGAILAHLDSLAFDWADADFGYRPRPELGDGQVIYKGAFRPKDARKYDEYIEVFF